MKATKETSKASIKLPNTTIVNGIVVELKDPSECQTAELGKIIFTKKSTTPSAPNLCNNFFSNLCFASCPQCATLNKNYTLLR